MLHGLPHLGVHDVVEYWAPVAAERRGDLDCVPPADVAFAHVGACELRVEADVAPLAPGNARAESEVSQGGVADLGWKDWLSANLGARTW